MAIAIDPRIADDVLFRAPVRPGTLELPAISAIASLMVQDERGETVQPFALLGPHDERIVLPESLCRILLVAVKRLNRGESVAVMGTDEELTTQQAADALNVSRPYLVRLLDTDKIPSHRVGTHRRVRVEDLERFRVDRDLRRRTHLHSMVRDAEEQGLYDVPELPAV